MMNDHGKSDRPIVPAKSLNNPEAQGAEAVEGRGLAKGNTDKQNTHRTQSRDRVPNALDRVRHRARMDRTERFTALFHHITLDRLRDAFLEMNQKAAPGVDGVVWEEYRAGLEKNIRDLHARLHRGAYRAKPTRRRNIPKPDGRSRPLGIATLEDKLVQKVVGDILNAIYEVDFLGFSYGFRAGRSQHQALDALATGIYRKTVRWVLDADIRSIFDTIDHGWLLKFLEHRIADRRLLRLIQKWLKAGVMEQGKWTKMKEGTPQGATISPLLANIYLHYVFDLWIQWWRRTQARTEVIVVRYADDIIIGFQRREDAERFQEAFRERLRKFSLELHPQKTRLIEFGRFAQTDRQARGLGSPETFNFLGFTHMCGRDRKGWFLLIRQTIRQRMQAKLKELKGILMQHRHRSIVEQGRWLRQVVQGWNAYYAVPTNIHKLSAFRREVERHWKRALSRRSQKGYVNWPRMRQIAARWLPRPKILHPWPQDRFDVRTQGRSPVR